MTTSSRSGNSEFERVMDAARTPGWSFGLGRHGQIMATRESGQIGLPWVVQATRAGRGLRVELFHPGDDTDVEGELIATVSGNPREMGRQLRAVMGELDVDNAD